MQYTRQYDFTQGTVIDSEQIDGEFNAIKNVINGNIEDDNLAISSEDIIKKIYPVGSLYITTNSDNPATILGIGTWTAFGAGRVLVGLDSGDTDFDTVEETGGGKTHSHSGTTGNDSPDHTHNYTGNNETGHSANGSYFNHFEPSVTWTSTGASARHTHSFSMGSGVANSTVQPYIVVKMWKRTA